MGNDQLPDSPSTDTLSDAELVLRCQNHEADAYRHLVERYRKRATTVAYNLVGNVDIARDISQEAFIRVLKSISSCDPSRGFKSWFDRVVVNLSIDYLRKHRRIKPVGLDLIAEPQAHTVGPQDETIRNETRRRVHEVLAMLPVKHKTVLVMRDIDGMDFSEMAEIFGKSPGTVRWRLSKARQAFKRLWERATPEIDGDAVT